MQWLSEQCFYSRNQKLCGMPLDVSWRHLESLKIQSQKSQCWDSAELGFQEALQLARSVGDTFEKLWSDLQKHKKTSHDALGTDQQNHWNSMISIPNQCKAQRDAEQQWGRNCRNWKISPGCTWRDFFFFSDWLEHSALTNFQGPRDGFVYSTSNINRYNWLLFICSFCLREGMALLNKLMSLIFICRLWALRP